MKKKSDRDFAYADQTSRLRIKDKFSSCSAIDEGANGDTAEREEDKKNCIFTSSPSMIIKSEP